MTNTRAGAAAWTQTRAGAVEQVGGDGRPARLSHEAAWSTNASGRDRGSGLPIAHGSRLGGRKGAAVGQPAQA